LRSGEPKSRYFGDILLFSLIIAMAAYLFFSFFPGTPSWIRKGLVEKLGLTLIGFMVLFLFSITLQFENRSISSWELALVGVMGSFSAASRIPFVVIPSVQPCTVIILAVGLVFGWRMGFMVGAITGLASNFFLPMGPWAIWQIFAWGTGGMVAGLAGRFYPKAGMVTLVVLAVFWGVIYGLILDLYTLGIFLAAGDSLTLAVIGKTYLPALPFNLLHVGGNVIFALLLGPSLLWVLQRFKKRYEWEVVPPLVVDKT
jgi:energy-coupling factor transport system substrate-specific component